MPFSKHHENDTPNFYLLDSFAESRFSPENSLILTCARTWATTEEIEQVLKPNLDWNYILDKADENRVMPILSYNIERVGDDSVPPKVMESLRINYFATVRHNLLASCELTKIFKAFSDTRIRLVVLKGIALSETVYRDVVPRPFGDIDLLVSSEDKYRIEFELSQLEYEIAWNIIEGSAGQPRFQRIYAKKDGMLIDLHWRIIEPPYSKYIDTSSFWEDVTSVDMEGTDIMVLSPENLLIHLCLHVVKERYSQLLWLVDISEVIHHYDETLDWKLILEKVEQYEINLLVHNVLSIVNQLFHSHIPIFVLERLSSCKSLSFEARLLGALANPGITGNQRLGVARFLEFYKTESVIKRTFGEILRNRTFMLKKYPDRSIYRAYCSRIWVALRAGVGFIGILFQLFVRRKMRRQK